METENGNENGNGKGRGKWKGHQSDYIFNAMKLAKQFRLLPGPEDVKTP